MGQILFIDKIGTMSFGGGNVTMAASISSPAYLTIGGQQYTITSSLSVSPGTATNGQRYQVFAVQSAGVVSLVISTNENSVGPASYTGWKLVASFYGNISSTFGGFVSITGSPQSDEIDGGVNSYSVSGGTVTKGSITVDTISWKREGSYAWVTSHFQQGAGASTGAGAVQLLLPGNLSADSTFYTFVTTVTSGATDAAQILGQANGWYSTNINDQVVLFDAQHFSFKTVLALATNGWWAGNSLGFGNAMGISMTIKVKISGWDNVALVDR